MNSGQNHHTRTLCATLGGIVLVLTLIALLGLIALGIVLSITPDLPDTPVTNTDDTSTSAADTTSSSPNPVGEDHPVSTTGNVVLAETPDRGQAYQDSLIFVGDSTTAHLRSRGVLSDGTNTEQVWVPADNTLLLDLNITQKKIVYPPTGEQMTIAQAAAKQKPAYMVLTIGLNGVTSFVNQKNLYQSCYGKLIQAIQEASPNTKIMLQSIFPVAASQTTFSVDATTLNGYIDTVNGYVKELAQTHGVRYLDTAAALKNASGNLPETYQNGDGIHLTAEGCRVILRYIRTHGYQ